MNSPCATTSSTCSTSNANTTVIQEPRQPSLLPVRGSRHRLAVSRSPSSRSEHDARYSGRMNEEGINYEITRGRGRIIEPLVNEHAIMANINRTEQRVDEAEKQHNDKTQNVGVVTEVAPVDTLHGRLGPASSTAFAPYGSGSCITGAQRTKKLMPWQQLQKATSSPLNDPSNKAGQKILPTSSQSPAAVTPSKIPHKLQHYRRPPLSPSPERPILVTPSRSTPTVIADPTSSLALSPDIHYNGAQNDQDDSSDRIKAKVKGVESTKPTADEEDEDLIARAKRRFLQLKQQLARDTGDAAAMNRETHM